PERQIARPPGAATTTPNFRSLSLSISLSLALSVMATNLLTQVTFSLDDLRNTLIRMEDSIIFGKGAGKFARNSKIYQPGAFRFEDGAKSEGKSFLEYFLHDVEAVHGEDGGSVGRFDPLWTRSCPAVSTFPHLFSPDEYAFTSPLPDPILPPLPYPRLLAANDVN
ncbi:MAG: hypothetical protein BJ554DRAFT_650, partial [Olpidium bornovanus]